MCYARYHTCIQQIDDAADPARLTEEAHISLALVGTLPASR